MGQEPLQSVWKRWKAFVRCHFWSDGIIEGYGQKKYTDETHPDWNIVEEGIGKMAHLKVEFYAMNTKGL